MSVTNKTMLMGLNGKKYNMSDVVLFESYFSFSYIQDCGIKIKISLVLENIHNIFC